MRAQRTLVSFGLVAAVAFAGTQLASAGDYKGKPGKYKELADVDKVEVVRVFKLADFAQLNVEPVDTSKTELPDKDDNNYETVKQILEDSTSLLTSSLRRNLGERVKVATGSAAASAAPVAAPAAAAPATGTTADPAAAPAAEPAAAAAETQSPAPSPKVLLLRARVVEMKPGSAAARFVVGFGAGRANTELTGEFVDAQTNEVLLKFETGRAGAGGGLKGMDTESLLSGSVREIGKDLAELLKLL